MELQTCLEEYQRKFGNENWLPSEFENEEEIRRLFYEISDLIDNCFIYLTRSILSGEYIEFSEFENILRDFLSTITGFDKIELSESTIHEDTIKSKFKAKFNELNNSLYNALRYYQNFIESSKSKFEFNLPNEKYVAFQIRNDESENVLSLFKDLTIPLCRYDYNLPIKPEDFQSLIIIRNRLIALKERTTSASLIGILSLLLYKSNYIIQRVKTTSFKSNTNFVSEVVNPSELDLGDYAFFTQKPIDDKRKYLDNINSNQQFVRSFVYLMKYYKDNLIDAKDIRLMDEIIERYLEKYNTFINTPFTAGEPFKHKYDTFSWNSVLNFLHNCRFSFYVQKCNPNLKEIKREINRIQDIQGSTYINNFHPYEKAIEALIFCVKERLKNNNFNDWLIQDKLDELDHLLEKYEKTLQWSELHKFFPFQLPFNESYFYSKGYKLKLFVPSAFAKNIDYKSLKMTLASLKKERDNLSFLFDLSKERRDIENLKETIKTTDKKAFDLIAIFTAAITFLFGTVNIFVVNDKTDLAQLLCNTTGLGIILILFTSLYLLASPMFIQRIDFLDYLKSRRFWFGLVGLGFYVSLTFNLFNYTKSIENNLMKDKYLKRMELRIDSLQQEQKSISSIIESTNKLNHNSTKNNAIKK